MINLTIEEKRDAIMRFEIDAEDFDREHAESAQRDIAQWAAAEVEASWRNGRAQGRGTWPPYASGYEDGWDCDICGRDCTGTMPAAAAAAVFRYSRQPRGGRDGFTTTIVRGEGRWARWAIAGMEAGRAACAGCTAGEPDTFDAYPEGWTCQGCGDEFVGIMPAAVDGGTTCAACTEEDAGAAGK